MSEPYRPEVIAARDQLAALLSDIDESLIACVAGKDYRCWCNGTIRRGDVCARTADTGLLRFHPDCVESWWDAVGPLVIGRRDPVQPVDLDALVEASDGA